MDDLSSWIGGALLGGVLAVIVMAVLRRGNSRVGGDMIERQRHSTLSAGSTGRDPDIMSDPQIRAAIESRQKILAIKLVRETYGLGLKQAKELVERTAPR